MTTLVDDKDLLHAALVGALLDSLTLNIELIEKITALASPEQRASPTFCATLERVESLKSVRSILAGERAP